jgi:translation initiation factor 3 subunit D
MLTVNETANEPPPEDGTMDSAKSLGLEAFFINHNFPQQVLKMVNLVFYLNNKLINTKICFFS